jgi:hypothetical protein
MKDVVGATSAAADGDIGHVRDFYFDDQAWVKTHHPSLI